MARTIVGVGLNYVRLNTKFVIVPLHFSSKDFEILDLDPPNNPTSHYGACHFGYSLALRTQFLRHNLSLRYLRGKNVYYKLIIFVLRLLSDKIA